MQKGPYFNPVQYISPLPEGYLQASSNIANTLGKAVQGFGENIASGIEKYTKNKEESALLDNQAPILLRDLQQRAKTAKNPDDIAYFTTLGDKLAKMPGQSVAQKRAIVSGLMTDLSLYDKRQQFEINQNQINAYKQDLATRNAYTQSLGLPTTRDVQRLENTSNLQDYSQFVNAPNQQLVQPDRTNFNLGLYGKDERQGTAMPLGASNAQDQQAQPEFMNSLAAIQANRPQPSAAPIAQPQAAPINPAAFAQSTPQPAAFDPSTILPNISRAFTQTKDNPYGTDYFSNAKQPISGPAPAQVAQQAPAPAPAAPVIAPAPAQQPVAAQRNLPSASQFDQSFNQNIDRVGQTSERTVTDKVDLTPNEKYTNQIASIISGGGQITPELNAQLKKDAGVYADADIKTEQIKDAQGRVVGTAVISRGTLSNLVLPEKPIGPQSDIGKKITDMNSLLAQGNFAGAQLIASELKQGNSKMTEAQGKAYQYSAELFETNKTIARLEASGFNPTNNTWDRFAPNFFKSNEGQQYYSAMDKWIEATLRDRSGAAIQPSEYGNARSQYFPNYGDSAANIAIKKELRNVAMQAMADRAEGKMNNRYFGSTGETSEQRKLPSGQTIKIERF